MFDNLQVVVNGGGENCKISCGSFLQVKGTIVESKGVRQPLDLVAEHFHVTGPNDNHLFPNNSVKKLRDIVEMRKIPHLRPRSEIFRAVMSARSKAIAIVSDFYAKENYLQTHPPILTDNKCEEGSEAFQVEVSCKCRNLWLSLFY